MEVDDGGEDEGDLEGEGEGIEGEKGLRVEHSDEDQMSGALMWSMEAMM